MNTRLLLSALALGVAFLGGCAGGQRTDATETLQEQYVFWPPLPAEPRIQFLTSFATSSDVEPERQQSALERLAFGEEQTVGVRIRKPYGVDMHAGRIYVCDISTPGLIVLDLRAQQMRLIGAGGSGVLKHPVDVAVADDGTIYVVDQGARLIKAYGRDERFAAVFTHGDMKPVGVEVKGDRLYVCDTQAQRVLVLNRFTGEELQQMGRDPVENEDIPGAMSWPLGIAVDDEGAIYVSDVLQARVHKFRPDGEPEYRLGYRSDRVGSFTRPKHVDVDADGLIYVVDAAFMNVQIFNQDRQVMTFFGNPGGEPYPGAMYLPAGLCIEELDEETTALFAKLIHPAFEARRLIVVTNQFGANRVSVYAMGGLREGRTIDDIAPTRLAIPEGTGEGAVTTVPGLQGAEEEGAEDSGDAGAEGDGTPGSTPGGGEAP